MVIYYLVGGFAMLSSLGSDLIRKTLRKPSFGFQRTTRSLWTPFDLISVCILSIFAGLRYFVGTDFWLYSGLIANMRGMSLGQVLSSSPQEVGFTTLGYFTQKIFPFDNSLFLVCSFLTVSFVYQTFRRESSSVAVSVGLYVTFAFYVTPFNTVRQGLAVAICFYARSKWQDSRLIAILLYATAATIHISAVLAILFQVTVHLVGRWRFFAPTVLTVAFIGAAAVLTLPEVRAAVGYLNPRYTDYLEEAGAGLGTLAVAAVFVFIALISASSAKESDDSPTKVWRSYLFVGAAFLIAGVAAAPVARMSQYFLIYLTLLAPRQISATDRRSWLYLPLFTLGGLFLAFWLSNYDGLLPYTWIGL